VTDLAARRLSPSGLRPTVDGRILAIFAAVTEEDTLDNPVVSPLRARLAEPSTGVIHEWPDTLTPAGISPQQAELSLGLTLEINVVRSKRTHCPKCGNRRVLYHLAAWSKGSPAGAGNALCASCAGFRATW
jgi:DNA-directed RNA polymerase subunit M/transcription elongation factor TFIIS